jgi:hypothetical protein
VEKEIEAFMYRIIKRIVQTVTTVTLLVRWEDSATRETVEKQIILPASHSLREEEVVDEVNVPNKIHPSPNPTLDYERRAKQRQSPKRDKGENNEY